MTGTSLLEVSGLDVAYGDVQVLWNVGLHVDEGEIVSIVGANAAGKTTLLNTISRILRERRGEVRFEGRSLSEAESHDAVLRGIVQVPEARRLFPFMTVDENLDLGGIVRKDDARKAEAREYALSLFPVLWERRRQLARTLSGGEQQMLAVARGLMACPKLLMLDEPSLGLSPKMVEKIFDVVRQINRRGVTVLLVEQKVGHSLELAHRGYVLENGRIALEGKGADLLADPHLRKAYLGR